MILARWQVLPDSFHFILECKVKLYSPNNKSVSLPAPRLPVVPDRQEDYDKKQDKHQYTNSEAHFGGCAQPRVGIGICVREIITMLFLARNWPKASKIN